MLSQYRLRFCEDSTFHRAKTKRECVLIMTIILKRCVIILISITVIQLPVTADEVIKTSFYVVNNSNKTIYGTEIASLRDGTIVLSLPSGGAQRFKTGTYKFAYCPKPDKIVAAEKLIQEKKNDAALELLAEALSEYGLIGWGGRIVFLQNIVLLRTGRTKEAEKSIRYGLTLPLRKKARSKLQLSLVDVLIKSQKLEEAEALIAKLSISEAAIEPNVYNRRGDLLSAKGKNKEAVLQYLKTILLLPDAGAKVRKAAYDRIIRSLKDLGDERYKQFIERRKVEFP